ncbi:hypothetical protein SS50377_21367 [Spironucleus salmonicida]|uniref:Transmembrane protein n=1 Tax=Spironucleus salmonicida TaxID=348837 RepID=A0A9P8S062_9EUKA|nr:hypothetical protein SS50377_21367 [Spironucleus salmonicida]
MNQYKIKSKVHCYQFLLFIHHQLSAILTILLMQYIKQKGQLMQIQNLQVSKNFDSPIWGQLYYIFTKQKSSYIYSCKNYLSKYNLDPNQGFRYNKIFYPLRTQIQINSYSHIYTQQIAQITLIKNCDNMVFTNFIVQYNQTIFKANIFIQLIFTNQYYKWLAYSDKLYIIIQTTI